MRKGIGMFFSYSVRITILLQMLKKKNQNEQTFREKNTQKWKARRNTSYRKNKINGHSPNKSF